MKTDKVRMRHPELEQEISVPRSAVPHHAAAGWEEIPDPPADSDSQAPAASGASPSSTPKGRRGSKQGE